MNVVENANVLLLQPNISPTNILDLAVSFGISVLHIALSHPLTAILETLNIHKI
jgi:hypothetical protein